MRHALRIEPLHPSTAGRRIALAAIATLAVLAIAVNALAEGSVQVRGLIDIVAGDDQLEDGVGDPERGEVGVQVP